ncbi:hypothetical protein ACP70R_046047 [Stipagrostis hirtigluma subsp. patula]
MMRELFPQYPITNKCADYNTPCYEIRRINDETRTINHSGDTRLTWKTPPMRRGKNHGHQPATISLSQEFWLQRLWRLTRESSLRRRASASLRQKPGMNNTVNLEHIQHAQGQTLQVLRATAGGFRNKVHSYKGKFIQDNDLLTRERSCTNTTT